MNRREFIRTTAFASLAAALGGCRSFGRAERKLAVNASTIRGYGLTLKEQVRAAVAAGCRGYEPWLKDVHVAKASGEFTDAVKMARDGGLQFVNGIAFGEWAHPDAKIRSRGIEETKRDMAALAEMGCPCVAASMFGVHKPGSPILKAEEIAERYASVLELGERMGVRPLLEYWGHSVNMNRLEVALAVLAFVGKDEAVLADVYHTYRGGGSFDAFRRLRPGQLPVLHVNDYPLTKPRTELVDADRVWPGDGAAPWTRLLAAMDAAGLDPWLSTEVFNPSYWRTDAVDTLKTSLSKMERLFKTNVPHLIY